jgi:hypothetical protein
MTASFLEQMLTIIRLDTERISPPSPTKGRRKSSWINQVTSLSGCQSGR